MTSYPLRIPGLQASLRLHVHAENDVHISRQILEHGVWEEFESQLVCRYLQAGDNFLDAGANIGYFSVLAAHRVGPRGRVFAFEPEPRNFALLQKNLRLNKLQQRVDAHQLALATTDGAADLYLHSDNLGDHQLFASESGRQVICVPTVNGAGLLMPKVESLKLVKIDTQGAEFQVVMGLFPLLLDSGSGLRMIVELTPFSLRAAGSSGTQLLNLLAELDLPFAIIDHIDQQLVSCTLDELLRWCENVDSCPRDQGFMNIFLGRL